MTYPTTPATTRIVISNDGGYTTTIKIRAFTEEKNAVMTWNIRTCGQETISLVNAARKFYIFGHETGSTSGMADATRYYTIPESTFSTWFTISPAGDPCVIATYELWASASTAWNLADTKILLTGSIGSYAVKLDKTVPVNG